MSLLCRGRSIQQMHFSDDRIATNAEQATGKKREELDAAARGESRFSLTPLRSAFGTYDNPVIVPSGSTSRIVGCQGGVEGVRIPLRHRKIARFCSCLHVIVVYR